MKAIIRAPLLSVSGYGVHSRQLLTYLENSEIDFDIETQTVNWGNTPWMINSDLENGQIGRIMEKSMKRDGISDISFQVQLPDEWDPNLARINIGLSAILETDLCNREWVDACNKMDAVIVPSLHAKEVLEASGEIDTSLHVVPEWFFPEIVENQSYDENFKNYDFGTKFNFLMVSQLTGQTPETDRKNIFYTLKWFCEVFKDDPDVGIVLKTNHGRGTSIDRMLTSGLLQNVLREVKVGDFPKIHFLHGNLTPNEMAGLYANSSVKAFVSLTRGEGFGLPLLESAASGLPVIATNWSAHTEFLSMGKFIPINYDLIDVPKSKVDGRIFVDGIKWADPHEKDFKKKVLKFREKPDMPKEWAQELSEKLRASYSSEAICKIYDKVIKEILEE